MNFLEVTTFLALLLNIKTIVVYLILLLFLIDLAKADSYNKIARILKIILYPILLIMNIYYKKFNIGLLFAALLINGVTFIGIEPYKKGFARAVEFFEETKPTNLYLFNGDAREFIELMDFSVNFIRIHFPDPWPKKRHTKRRLISKQFLKTLSKILCSDGLVQIVTDSKIYQMHIDEVLEHQQLFETTNSFPISYQVSTFHKKGLNKGHTIKEYNLKLITPCNQTSG